MEKIKKVTVRINNNEKIYYEWNGEKFNTPNEVLKQIFKNQGELYERIYHVEREIAKDAGWHPDDRDFSNLCGGWEKFLRDRGKICKEVIEEEFTIEEFTKSYVGF